jgi:hypothetical protein
VQLRRQRTGPVVVVRHGRGLELDHLRRLLLLLLLPLLLLLLLL